MHCREGWLKRRSRDAGMSIIFPSLPSFPSFPSSQSSDTGSRSTTRRVLPSRLSRLAA